MAFFSNFRRSRKGNLRLIAIGILIFVTFCFRDGTCSDENGDTTGILTPITKFASFTKGFIQNKFKDGIASLKQTKPMKKAMLSVNAPTIDKDTVIPKLKSCGSGFVQYLNFIQQLQNPGPAALVKGLLSSSAKNVFAQYSSSLAYQRPELAYSRLSEYSSRFNAILAPFMHHRGYPYPAYTVKQAIDKQSVISLFDKFSTELASHLAFLCDSFSNPERTEQVKQYLRKMLPRLKRTVSTAWDVLETGVSEQEGLYNKRVLSSFVHSLVDLDAACQEVATAFAPLFQQYADKTVQDFYLATPPLTLSEIIEN